MFNKHHNCVIFSGRRTKNKNRNEYRERRRLAARKKREEIKSDPVLYQQWKEKERERYMQRKKENKLPSISELPIKKRRKVRERNRQNSRAYYIKKKIKMVLEKEVAKLTFS